MVSDASTRQFLNTGFPAGKATDGWREELGVPYDLGPHLLDLMELAAGPVHAVRAEGNKDYVTLSTFHSDGACAAPYRCPVAQLPGQDGVQ